MIDEPIISQRLHQEHSNLDNDRHEQEQDIRCDDAIRDMYMVKRR